MFYSEVILAKKGPLAKIWLAAQDEGKLNKAQIVNAKLDIPVDEIAFPIEPLALRMSAHLLQGVVRILLKKTNYLVKDYSDCVIRIRMGPSLNHKNAVDQINFKVTAITDHVNIFNGLTNSNSLSNIANLKSDVLNISNSTDHTSKPQDITMSFRSPIKDGSATKTNRLKWNSAFSLTGDDGMDFTISNFDSNDAPITTSTNKKRKLRRFGTLGPVIETSGALSGDYSTSLPSIEHPRFADAERSSIGLAEHNFSARKNSDAALKESVNSTFDIGQNVEVSRQLDFNVQDFSMPIESPVKLEPPAVVFEKNDLKPFKIKKTKMAKTVKRKKGVKVANVTEIAHSKLQHWRNVNEDITITRIPLARRLQTFYKAGETGFMQEVLNRRFCEDFSAVMPFHLNPSESLLELISCPSQNIFLGISQEAKDSEENEDIEIPRASTISESQHFSVPSASAIRKSEKPIPEARQENSEIEPSFDFERFPGNQTIESSFSVIGAEAVNDDTSATANLNSNEGNASNNIQPFPKNGSFFKASIGMSRKEAAQLFLKLLHLKTKNEIEIQQDGSFEDIFYHSIA